MKLKEVSFGKKFIFNNEEYVRIKPIKVSCCRTVVAEKTSNGEQVSINLDEEVTLVQDEQ